MRRLWTIALALASPAIISHAQQPAQPAPAPPSAQPTANKINPPKPINNVEAQFSEDARRRRISGLCVVSLTVDSNGMPQDPKVVSCTDPSFEETSLDAAKQYRFQPATTPEGKLIAATIRLEIVYKTFGTGDPEMPNRHPELKIHYPKLPIHYTISTPPGISSSAPGPDGVYPFTNLSAPPMMINFSDEGFRNVASLSTSPTACDILLTISAKGKPYDPQVIHCETPELEKPAVQSLMKSSYKPGKVNRKAVPMRASIHLEYGDMSPKS